MTRKILLLILLIMPVAGHSQNKQPYVIDPRLFGAEKITLGDMADDITYIPLDNAIPFGRVTRIIVNEHNIYINDIDAGILKFNRSGKLIFKIGSKGRGPGEYLSASSLAVDELTGNVYILEAPSKIKVYSSTGRFIRDINFNRDLIGLGTGMKMFNSKIFLADYISMGSAKNVWAVLDTTGNIITKKSNSVPPLELRNDIAMAGEPVYVSEFDNNLYYFNSYNDTVFIVSKDFKSNTAYLFAHGDFRIPPRYLNKEERGKVFRPGEIFLTGKYFLLRYQYLEKSATAVIEKNRWKIYNVPSIINDIDGGVPFVPRCYFYDSKSQTEYLVRDIDPLTLKKRIESSQFNNGTFRDPVKQKVFKVMASKLNESDNPVLMFVKLKK
jgi:hypothetical protein